MIVDTTPPSIDITASLVDVVASESNPRLRCRWRCAHPTTSMLNQTVTLLSISCDDGCDVWFNLLAMLGIDYRAFHLGATRRGDSSGRRYVIDYRATDSAGNAAFAQTSVVVSHDQR